MNQSHVVFSKVAKDYHDFSALREVSLEIQQGEFFSLLGPSGCGKTTTLRILAGFLSPTAGSVTLNGRDITGMPPERRNIGLVFQDYAIFPHMTVFDNVAFGLKVRKQSKSTVQKKVMAALEQVGLSEHAYAHKRHMSGGQQQRVALARALVTEPDVLLLDEPLSALDLKLREEMRYWIRSLQKRLGITTIYVTHDQTEALTMSDRIAVMSNGEVMQVGTPSELYEQPSSHFVASFLGTSSSLPITLAPSDGGVAVMVGSQQVLTAPPRNIPFGATELLVRPEQVKLTTHQHDIPTSDVRFEATISAVSYEGSVLRYVATDPRNGLTVMGDRANSSGHARLSVGDHVVAHWPSEVTHFFPR